MCRGGAAGGCVWGVTRMRGAGLRPGEANTGGVDTRTESTALCLCSLGPGPGKNGQPETDKELCGEQIYRMIFLILGVLQGFFLGLQKSTKASMCS